MSFWPLRPVNLTQRPVLGLTINPGGHDIPYVVFTFL